MPEWKSWVIYEYGYSTNSVYEDRGEAVERMNRYTGLDDWIEVGVTKLADDPRGGGVEGESDNDVNGSEQDIWTDFETEQGACGSVSEDGHIVWGAYCPQPDCGTLNTFRGDPSKFVNRPYRCLECNWVSLMDGSVAEIKRSLHTDSDTP